MTGSQYHTYLELNRGALSRATVRGERPDVLYWGVSAERASADKFAELETTDEQPGKQEEATPQRARKSGGRGGKGGKTAHYMNSENG